MKPTLPAVAWIAVGMWFTPQILRASSEEHPTEVRAEASAGPAKPQLRLAVDPRVELVSLVFRLAGNPEYNQARVASYQDEVEQQFGPYRNHPCINLARQLRSTQGVSYDACMSLAVSLTGPYKPALAIPLDPWPDFLDRRWTPESASHFVALLRNFVDDTSFREFINHHTDLYQTTDSRLRDLLDKESHLEWFQSFFGARPQATFTIIPALLNGGSCYGPHSRDASGREELFCILGVWETDGQGVPSFGRDMMSTVIHEFCHSYANAIIDRHAAEFQSGGGKLFRTVADKMRSQAYGSAETMLRESLVRACVIRYLRQYDGPAAATKAVAQEKAKGFVWMDELSALLGNYEAQRDLYPTLEAFAPRLVSFFNTYADRFVQEQELLSTKQPKVVSMLPANGASDVDPGLTNIQVVFDRPMRDQCWSMVGGGPHFPQTTGKPHYDERKLTWTAPVQLKPDWSYEFWLNAGRFTAFQSAEGVALDSVPVRFKTANSKAR